MSQKPTPEVIENRPGLSELQRRVGRHSTIRTSLLQSLSDRHRPGLRPLTTRDPQDFTIAMLDAFSQLGDTLTFYQERISNESYLGTAKDYVSVLELAALVDYRPAPASAAQVYLAFTVDDTLPFKGVIDIDPGVAVKNLPLEEDLPQTFETLTPLRAKAAWNEIKAAQSHTQQLNSLSDRFYISASSPRPRRGDPILLLNGSVPSIHGAAPRNYLCFAHDIREASSPGLIRVDLARTPSQAVNTAALVLPEPSPSQSLISGTAEQCRELLKSYRWERHDIQAAQDQFGLTTQDLQATLAWKAPGLAPEGMSPVKLNVRARLFGHNALPPPFVLNSAGATVPAYVAPGNILQAKGVLSPDEDPSERHNFLFLDRKYEDIVEGDILVLRGRKSAVTSFFPDRDIEDWARIQSVATVSVSGFGQSAEITRLEIRSSSIALRRIKLRSVEIFTGSEVLTLAQLPIEDPIGPGSTIDTDDIQLLCEGALLDLTAGQDVALSGVRTDMSGVPAAQILRISEITLHGNHTALNFTSAFKYPFQRQTTHLNANLALASHGESIVEPLGSGDGTQSHQSFELSRAPLTYLPANTPEGSAPALEIQVNDIRWERVASLAEAGPADRVYTVTTSGSGPTKIMFGNGTQGARLPSGQNNVTALYRVGAGIGGRVKAGLISLLVNKPLGIRSVTNPLPAFGGSAVETRDQARQNVPVKGLTLDRIVSLNDYRDFARSFTGIAKAHASWGWEGENRIACVSVAAEDGQPLPETDGILPLLRNMIRQVSPPGGAAVVKNFQPVFAALSAKIFVDPNAVITDGSIDAIFDSIRAHLAKEFGFAKQGLGAPLRLSHVAASIQSVPGVIAADIDYLHRLDAPTTRQEIVRAFRPPRGDRAPSRGVELLILAPEHIQLGVAT